MALSSGSKPRVICLMGPTASGKTDLAIEIAQALDCELISVDSALVYRGLDIGSAKPDYPHHLVDVRDPAQPYSAADFVSDAEAAVQAILARGRTPLLVGGTMLYFKAFLEGLAQMPAADPSVRAAIEAEAASSGWPALHAELARVDPDSAARIHPNHSQRLSRALEVYRVSGTPLSQWQDAGDRPGALARYDVRQMALSPARREVLHQRIELRFTHMLEAGFLDEVARLRARPDLDETLPAVRAVGYRQLWQHLAGEYDLEEATRRAVAATRQLAKRQLTWLRKWPDLTWLLTDDSGVRLVPAGEGQNAAESAETPLLAALRLLDQPRV